MVYLSALLILCSCALGMILEFKFKVQSPSLYWFIGSMGTLGAFTIRRFLLGGK